MQLEEQTVEQTTVYQGLIVNVRRDKARLPNGKIVNREVVEHPGGVAVLPLDDQGNITMVRQYRYPGQQLMLEIPAGKLEPGEDPADCGRRELHEEVGFTAGRYELLCTMDPSPGYCAEKLHLYLARQLTYIGLQPDDDEFLDIVKLPFADVVAQVCRGELSDAKTALAVLLTQAKLREEAALSE